MKRIGTFLITMVTGMLLLSGCSEYATSKNPVEKKSTAETPTAAAQTEQKSGAKIAVIETDKGPSSQRAYAAAGRCCSRSRASS